MSLRLRVPTVYSTAAITNEYVDIAWIGFERVATSYLTATEGNDTLAAAGQAIAGSYADIIEADDTVSSTAKLYIFGQSSITEAGDTLFSTNDPTAYVSVQVYVTGVSATASTAAVSVTTRTDTTDPKPPATWVDVDDSQTPNWSSVG